MRTIFILIVIVSIVLIGIVACPKKNAEAVTEDNTIYERIGNIGWDKIKTIGIGTDEEISFPIKISPDNKYILYATVKNDIKMIYLRGLKDYKIYRSFLGLGVNEIEFSPDGKNIVMTTLFEKIMFYDIEKNSLTIKKAENLWDDAKIVFSKNSKFAAINYQGKISIWDLTSKLNVKDIKREYIIKEKNNNSDIVPLDLNENGDEIIIATDKGMIVYDVLNNKIKNKMDIGSLSLELALKYMKDGNRIIFALGGSSVCIVDTKTGVILSVYNINTKGMISKIKIDKDEKLALIEIVNPAQVKIIDLKRGTEVDNVFLNVEEAATDFSPNGNYFVVANRLSGVDVYKVTNRPGNIESGSRMIKNGDVNKVNKYVADKSFDKGKYYFEIKVNKKIDYENEERRYSDEREMSEKAIIEEKEKSDTFKNVDFGVTDSKTGGMMVGMSNYISKDSLEDGDCIMVAIDFDSKIIYFGKNNSWIFCDPVAGSGGKSLSTFSNILPYLMVTNKEELKINFGGEPFKGTMPSGYNKYNLNNMSQVN